MTIIKSYNYNLTKFITSTIDIKYLSIDSGIEIAFAGRSNAGKSSVINALTNKKNLARTSKTPGQTKFINLFEVEPGIRLVDLPGYGYAAVNNKLKYKLQHVLENYLQMRNSFKGLVLIIDIRHTIKNIDKQIIKWAIDNNFPLLILLNKSDKLSLMACNKQLIAIRKIALTCMGDVQVEIFSSSKKYGIDKLQQKLNYWFTTFSS